MTAKKIMDKGRENGLGFQHDDGTVAPGKRGRERGKE
jgi:hypothetical protein